MKFVSFFHFLFTDELEWGSQLFETFARRLSGTEGTVKAGLFEMRNAGRLVSQGFIT